MTNQESTANTPEFADALIALGNNLKQHPNLPKVAMTRWRYWEPGGFRKSLDVQLCGDAPDLVAWARTMTDVSSRAQRMSDRSVHYHVYGLLDGCAVRVWGSGEADVFDENSESDWLEWDVTALLQEA